MITAAAGSNGSIFDRCVECLYCAAGEVPLKGPNDLVFDRHGGFYFTDPGKVRAREMDRGTVYYARADGTQIGEVAFPLVTPNGIGLSPDEKTLYVAETEPARVWALTSSSRASCASSRGLRRMADGSWPGSAATSVSIRSPSMPKAGFASPH